MPSDHLHIYVNDHLTGATGGVALARRAARNSTDGERTAMWTELAAEIAEDREALGHIRDLIGARPNRAKYTLARVGEMAGRLKTNGHLWRRSEIGQFLELEMMMLGVTGKLALWRALERLGDPRLEGIDLEELIRRAESQRSRLEQFRISLVPAALDGAG